MYLFNSYYIFQNKKNSLYPSLWIFESIVSGSLLNRLIFFGGYGYLPEDKVLGTFEFDETSFWVSEITYFPT